MITIILIVCHLAAPFDCKEEPMQPMAQQQIGPPTPMSLFDCTMHGEEIAQDWVHDHPNWMLYRWRCEAGRRAEKPA